MARSIVITTINSPSKAVKKFAELEGYSLIIVGDKKTPNPWFLNSTKFISIEEQSALGYRLSAALPFNHYCRKMLGYIYALRNGAEMIVDTDDDNLPKSGWSFPEFHGNFEETADNLGFVNVYGLYTEKHVWPRGLPLRLISEHAPLTTERSNEVVRIGIWQGLADEDPDVDAIYRLTSDDPIYFDERPPVVLGAGTISPFNSQNTIFCRSCVPLMYLPTKVTFRFTDILRGLVAQPIMWKHDLRLGFTNATVVQKRNPHDYMKDFESEIPMYLHSEKVVEIVDAATTGSASIPDNLYRSYEALVREGIVPADEMTSLTAWVHDLEDVGSSI